MVQERHQPRYYIFVTVTTITTKTTFLNYALVEFFNYLFEITKILLTFDKTLKSNVCHDNASDNGIIFVVYTTLPLVNIKIL